MKRPPNYGALSALLLIGALMAPATLFAQTRVEPGFNLFSVEQDVEIGRQSAEQVEKELPLLRDRRADRYVNEVGKRLAAEAPHGEYPYQFKILNLAEVNAFALPGGFMYVDRGLIETVRSEDELAGVLAHEIAHVDLRHGTNQASKAYLANAGLGVLGGLLGEGTTRDVIGAVGGFGLNTVFLKFSRDAEQQADIVGAQILARAGYDPLAMVDMFETLRGQQQHDPSALEEFFSSHPPYDGRQESIRRESQYLKVERRPEFGGLASVQADLRSKSAAPRMAELLAEASAKDDSRNPEPNHGEDREARKIDVANPSRDLSSFEQKDGYFSVRYPRNWDVSESTTDFGATLAPRGGIVLRDDGRREIVYGVIVNHYVPFRGSARDASGPLMGFAEDVGPPMPDAPRDLEMATLDLVDHILQANPHLEVEHRDAVVRAIDGAPAVMLRMSGRNPVTRRDERVTVVARKTEGDEHVIYVLLIAPENDFDRFAAAFDAMLSSLRVDDRVVHRSR